MVMLHHCMCCRCHFPRLEVEACIIAEAGVCGDCTHGGSVCSAAAICLPTPAPQCTWQSAAVGGASHIWQSLRHIHSTYASSCANSGDLRLPAPNSICTCEQTPAAMCTDIWILCECMYSSVSDNCEAVPLNASHWC